MRDLNSNTNKILVVMTDNFMSNWGASENLTNKYIVVCENMLQANKIYKNAKKRSEMSNVRITTVGLNRRFKNKKKYLLSVVYFNNLGTVWTK